MYQKNDGTTRKVLRPPERVGTPLSTGLHVYRNYDTATAIARNPGC
jgi:hypothetical protein